MKRILLALFLSMGTLLPTLQAKSSMSVSSRVLKIHLEGYVFIATSDETSGPIQEIHVYNIQTGQLELAQKFNEYSATLKLDELSPGIYAVAVIATNQILRQQIALGL